MAEIFNLIFENKNTILTKNKINEIFHNIVNDLSKDELLDLIKKIFILIKNNKQEDLLIRILPEIISFSECYYEEISDIIVEYDFASYFVKKYKNISTQDKDLFCSYNYLLEVLKQINNKYSICKNNKKWKEFNNIPNKYYLILNEVNDLNNIYGLEFYKTKLKKDITTLLSHSDYLFIKEYYKKYSKLIKKDNNLFDKMINDDLFIYIMQLDNIPIIEEIKHYINEEFKEFFELLSKKQLKYRQEFINGDFTNMESYFHIHNITGNIINDTLANYILNLAFNNVEYIKEESIIASIRSLAYYYLQSLNLEIHSIVVKNARDMNFKRGSYKAHPIKRITINKTLVKTFLKNKDITMLVTLFHELEHAKQNRKNNSYFEYQMQKEQIIIRNFPNYYLDNYQFVLEEIDARLNGTICLIRYLEQLVPNLAELYKSKLLNDIKEENKLINELNANDTIYSLESKIDDYFNEIVIKKPNIIKRNKIFQIEYKMNGQIRNDLELLENYQNLSKKEQLFTKEIIKVRLNTSLYNLLLKIQIPFKNQNIYIYYMDILSKKIIENITINNQEEIINYLYQLESNYYIELIINKITKKAKK